MYCTNDYTLKTKSYIFFHSSLINGFIEAKAWHKIMLKVKKIKSWLDRRLGYTKTL